MSGLIDVQPNTELLFKLTAGEATPKCNMTLRHTDPKGAPVAFKVKTTQPRRYLVRPNQGLIQPGGTEQVQIILVEKDKTQLMQSYQRLGQTALDHSKDKFLVQYLTIDPEQQNKLKDYDQLTTLWTSVQSGNAGSIATSPVENKKLPVKHKVDDAAVEVDIAPSAASQQPVETMSTDQLKAEMSALRRKYDELVAFSVNLTAERDILNNTLEQTKRDLNREMAKNAAGENRRTPLSARGATATSGSVSWMLVLVLAIVFTLLGVRLEQLHHTQFLQNVPVLGDLFQSEKAPTSDAGAAGVGGEL